MSKNKPLPHIEIEPFDHFKFLSKIQVRQSGCWEWTGGATGKEKHNYGMFSVYNKETKKITSYRAHRASYTLFKEKIKDDYVIDHICRNTMCLNPDHLRQVTKKTNATENSMAPSAINFNKSHCVNGHEFTEENTRYYDGKRSCISCWKEREASCAKERRKRNPHNYNDGIFNKTHCKYGHELNNDSVYIYIRKNGNEYRKCKKCNSISGAVKRALVKSKNHDS